MASAAGGLRPRVVAAIDQGTTSSRCLLFARDGAVVGSAQREHRQITPRPGWVEHDPVEIWDRTAEVVAGALRNGGLEGSDIAAVGITNQRETTVVWDPATGEPLAPAIVWQDTRTAELAADLGRTIGAERLRELTGLPAATYFSGPKLRWLLENQEGLRECADAGRAVFGTVESWLVWKLTGGAVHRTDATNASRTLMMDLGDLRWNDELLDALGVPGRMLPEIAPSSHPEAWGHTTTDGPLGASVPITGVIGDQQAALLGQLRRRPGEAKCTYGTGAFLLMHTGAEAIASKAGLLTTVAYSDPDRVEYALEGSVAVAGSLVQWLRDQLGFAESAAKVEELALQVEDSGGAVIVPAFSGLFAPWWRSDARGVICGLTRHTDRRHSGAGRDRGLRVPGPRGDRGDARRRRPCPARTPGGRRHDGERSSAGVPGGHSGDPGGASPVRGNHGSRGGGGSGTRHRVLGIRDRVGGGSRRGRPVRTDDQRGGAGGAAGYLE